MKGKVTSLVLVGSAFIIGIVTQDSSPGVLVGSHFVTALIMMTWFGVMGTGLYFWAKHANREHFEQQSHQTEQQFHQTPIDENSSLRQLAKAIGPNQTVPVTGNVARAEETVHQEETQKSLS